MTEALIGFAAIAIRPTEKIVAAVNEHFSQQVDSRTSWPGLNLSAILDQSLKLNLQSLTDRVASEPHQMALDSIEINGQAYNLSAQAIQGAKGVAYVIVVFVPGGGAS